MSVMLLPKYSRVWRKEKREKKTNEKSKSKNSPRTIDFGFGFAKELKIQDI